MVVDCSSHYEVQCLIHVMLYIVCVFSGFAVVSEGMGGTGVL